MPILLTRTRKTSLRFDEDCGKMKKTFRQKTALPKLKIRERYKPPSFTKKTRPPRELVVYNTLPTKENRHFKNSLPISALLEPCSPD